MAKDKIKAWAVIDRDTGELETFNDGRPAIWFDAGEPMKYMENFIKISGKVLPVQIIILND